MALKIIQGNLIELAQQGEFDAIMHGCNCQKLMRSGIAGQIANWYPLAEEVDKVDLRSPLAKLGDYTIAVVGKLNIINAYTQYNPGPDFMPWALERVLFVLSKSIITNQGEPRIGVPWIGCGIGGSTKEIVQPIFERYADKLNITIVELP